MTLQLMASKTPNKFGTQKSRHQPLAEASGMNVWFDDAAESKPCYGLQSVVDDEETERRL